MGVRANALFEHHVTDFRDHAAVLSALVPALPAALAVAEYWHVIHDSDRTDEPLTWWVQDLQNPDAGEYLRYCGPGGLSIGFDQRVAYIRASCRWSGFSTIASLQQLHVAAFKSIARALGGTRMVIIPDNDIVMDAIYAGENLDGCIGILRNALSSPPADTVILSGSVEGWKTWPWFVESLSQEH